MSDSKQLQVMNLPGALHCIAKSPMGGFVVYFMLKHLFNVAVQLNSQPLPRVCKINTIYCQLLSRAQVWCELQLLSPETNVRLSLA